MMPNVFQLHEHEKFIAAAQTRAGRFAIWACGISLLSWHDTAVFMTVSFTLVLLFPNQRRVLLAIAAVGTIFEKLLSRQGIEFGSASLTLEAIGSLPWLRLSIQVTVATVCLYAACFVATRFDRFPRIIKQFPLVTLHILIWIALALSSVPPLGALGFTSFIAWRLSYLYADASRGKATDTGFKDHLFYLVPVFGGSATPYGKGLGYLARHEASDAGSIARSQLAGIKLLILAIIWNTVRALMDDVVFGQVSKFSSLWLGGWVLGVPRLVEIIRFDTISSIPVAWASIYLELIRATLVLAAAGHVIVGCLRLLGFNAFRNTYKPLLAETIVEFWNRYYFYFKELLVEFFFYPTYLRCRWAAPKLRIFLAVFAAAFVGNMYYHLLDSPYSVINLNLMSLWVDWGSRLVYCFLLAFGIWVSMLRQQKKRLMSTQVGFGAKFRSIVGVWTFYAVIHIWNIRAPEIGFGERFHFVASLFGL